jgi:polyphosphate glucokinase
VPRSKPRKAAADDRPDEPPAEPVETAAGDLTDETVAGDLPDDLPGHLPDEEADDLPDEEPAGELTDHAALVAAEAFVLADAHVGDDQDKAGTHSGEIIDAGDRRLGIGVDVGGSGIKAAAIDLDTGELVSPRHRVPTPVPSAPAAVIASIARIVKKISREVKLAPDVPVGVGFPSVVIDGHTRSAANVDAGWVDFDADGAMERVLRRPVHIVNDADAAGVAEMRFGAGVGEPGTVFLITLGTGLGSALFHDGRLVPNLELGHMEIRGRDAERRSAAIARTRRGLSWKAWASDLDEHLLAIEKLFSPRLFIIGGGVSKRADLFVPRLTVRAAVVPAKLRNDAGIVGAALAAAEREAAKPR